MVIDEKRAFVQANIIKDMSEGVVTIGMGGAILDANPAAADILEIPLDSLVGSKFATTFFLYEENDAFNQAILNAIYEDTIVHNAVVPYFTGTKSKNLFITTSFLRQEEEVIGVIAVLNDISELIELRDAVAAMEKIKALNAQLELRNRFISKAFGRYLSDDIVKNLLDTPDGLALGGKKQPVTILMSDLRGFTAMCEVMDAQDVLTMLNHYLAVMVDIIEHYNGTIIEFIGDAILAIFGAPVYKDSHATDAVCCAIEMQNAMEAVNEYNKTNGFPDLQMGIGINSGEPIVGNIGSEKRTKYGVLGPNVNLCGRIESYTLGGQVLISPSTREKITAPLEIAGEQEIYPKGVKRSITISHVIGIGAPYHLHCVQAEKEPLHLLQNPLQMDIYRIVDKHCSNLAEPGTLTAINKDGAMIQTEAELPALCNIKCTLRRGEEVLAEDIFAKVSPKPEKEGLPIAFTSTPPYFEGLLEDLKTGH